MLEGVNVDGFVFAAVDGEVCLAITVEVELASGYPALDGRFVDAGGYSLAVSNDIAGKADI